MSSPATEVVKRVNGHIGKDGRWKRSADSIARQVRTAARNRREALAAGKPYGHSRPSGRRKPALKGSRKPVRGRVPGGATDALIYLGHARSKLLKAAIAAGSIEVGTGSVLGLIALAIEALGGD